MVTSFVLLLGAIAEAGMTTEAILGFLTALVVLLTAVVGLAVVWLGRRVQEVHVLVNSHAEDQARRIAQLTEALTGANVDVPDKPESNEGKKQ